MQLVEVMTEEVVTEDVVEEEVEVGEGDAVGEMEEGDDQVQTAGSEMEVQAVAWEEAGQEVFLVVEDIVQVVQVVTDGLVVTQEEQGVQEVQEAVLVVEHIMQVVEVVTEEEVVTQEVVEDEAEVGEAVEVRELENQEGQVQAVEWNEEGDVVTQEEKPQEPEMAQAQFPQASGHSPLAA